MPPVFSAGLIKLFQHIAQVIDTNITAIVVRGLGGLAIGILTVIFVFRAGGIHQRFEGCRQLRIDPQVGIVRHQAESPCILCSRVKFETKGGIVRFHSQE